MKALIYARVSKDSSGIERSIDEQIEDLQRWIKEEGWTCVDIVRETGSASRFAPKSRPGWQRVLEIIASKKVGVLCVWESSRATRDMGEFAEMRDMLAKHGVKLGYGRSVYDFDDVTDNLRAGIDTVLAETESRRTSVRVRRAGDANAAAGRPHGKLLYGYRRVYDESTGALVRVEIDPVTSPFVVEAYSRARRGHSLYSIAASFNERGIGPRRPKRADSRSLDGWTGAAVKSMLMTASYAGLRQHRGEIIGPAAWPALVEPDLWNETKAMLTAPHRRREAPWKPTHLLTGIVECGMPGCPGRMRVTRNSAKRADGLGHYNVYQCGVRPHVSISMRYLDAIVTEHIVERMSRQDFIESLRGVDDAATIERREIVARIEDLEKYLDRVRDRAIAELNDELLFDTERRVAPQIRELRQQLERITRASPGTLALARQEDVRSAWDGLAIEERREVIRSLVNVTVLPATRLGVRGAEPALERTQISWVHES